MRAQLEALQVLRELYGARGAARVHEPAASELHSAAAELQVSIDQLALEQGSDRMSRARFVECCRAVVGESVSVVIKFMQDEQQWRLLRTTWQ